MASLLTRVEVDPLDPAFLTPTKPIGPVCTKAQADDLARRRQWAIAAEATGWRRVVPSPKPVRVPGLDVIRGLLNKGVLVIAAGGGGIPVVPRPDGRGTQGAEAVIDKDLCSALIATDVDAVYLDWGLPTQRAIGRTTPAALAAHAFAAGSMAPKVEAACSCVQASGRRAAIGTLDDIEALLAGQRGTQITAESA